MRATCSFVWPADFQRACVCVRVFSSLPLLARANRDCWHPFHSTVVYGVGEVRPCWRKEEGVWGRSRGGGGDAGEALLDGILVTWGELLSSFNPATPFSPCPLPGAQAECSVRRVSTEHPLCVLTKAECPGDKRGRSGLRGTQSQGEERVGKGVDVRGKGRSGGGGRRGGLVRVKSAGG